MTTQTRGRVRVEPTLKRIRNQMGGVTVADSTNVLMVWEIPYYPTYYFPQGDVRLDLLTATGTTKRSPARGSADLYTITVGEQTAVDAARVWNDAKIEDTQGYVSFVWKAMDAWFEEDEEVYVHARDPYTRIDSLVSSRNIRVEVDGVVVAESDRAKFLYETGLPTRYYVPKTDVHFQYLTATDTETACPYKGTARYWSVKVNGNTHSDVVWGYDAPLKESMQVAGMVAFYNEKLDIYVDGVLEDKPKTKFS